MSATRDPRRQRRNRSNRPGRLQRVWNWFDRANTARDATRTVRGGRSRGRGDGCGCDGCGCDLFHLSLFRAVLLTAPTRPPRTRASLPGRVGLVAIRGYQRWLSHRLPTHCPHTPTCSHYGLAVVRRYGLLEGTRLAGGRIARCSGAVPRGTADPPP